MDVGGPSAFCVKNEADGGTWPIGFLDSATLEDDGISRAEPSTNRGMWGVEWFPRRVIEGLEGEGRREGRRGTGARVTEAVRGRGGVNKGGSSSDSLSSDEESRSSIALGWDWSSSKKEEGGDAGAGAECMDWGGMLVRMRSDSVSCLSRSRRGNGGVVGSGAHKSITDSFAVEKCPWSDDEDLLFCVRAEVA